MLLYHYVNKSLEKGKIIMFNCIATILIITIKGDINNIPDEAIMLSKQLHYFKN